MNKFNDYKVLKRAVEGCAITRWRLPATNFGLMMRMTNDPLHYFKRNVLTESKRINRFVTQGQSAFRAIHVAPSTSCMSRSGEFTFYPRTLLNFPVFRYLLSSVHGGYSVTSPILTIFSIYKASDWKRYQVCLDFFLIYLLPLCFLLVFV